MTSEFLASEFLASGFTTLWPPLRERITDIFRKPNPEGYDFDVSHVLQLLLCGVHFKRPEDFNEWKRIFEKPEKSRASLTEHLIFDHAKPFNEADVSWIKQFSHVKILEVSNGCDPASEPTPSGSFLAFCNLSKNVMSLRVGSRDLPLQEVFDLICSFPCLENLGVVAYGRDRDELISLPLPSVSNLPKFTGKLTLGTSTAGFVQQLLESQIPLFFQEIRLQRGNANQIKAVNDLVKKCSDTLRYIEVNCPRSMPGESCPFPLRQQLTLGI